MHQQLQQLSPIYISTLRRGRPLAFQPMRVPPCIPQLVPRVQSAKGAGLGQLRHRDTVNLALPATPSRCCFALRELSGCLL